MLTIKQAPVVERFQIGQVILDPDPKKLSKDFRC